jgi:hypothetical protein
MLQCTELPILRDMPLKVEKHILGIVVTENKKEGRGKDIIGNYSHLWNGLGTGARAI